MVPFSSLHLALLAPNTCIGWCERWAELWRDQLGVACVQRLCVSCARPSVGPPLVLCRLKDVAGFLADRKYHLTTYKKCFVGNEFVDWLVANGEVTERQEGVELGRQLLDSGTIHHGQHSTSARPFVIMNV